MNISTISGAIVRVQIAAPSGSALNGSDFPKEKEEVPKEDGSNKSESKKSIFFTPREKLEDVFLGVPSDFDVCWNRGSI
uniref:Uncharacterized protein n=1 Tax=Aegilops tauschii TaxID=37682 RepID=M8B906_AEGTA